MQGETYRTLSTATDAPSARFLRSFGGAYDAGGISAYDATGLVAFAVDIVSLVLSPHNEL